MLSSSFPVFLPFPFVPLLVPLSLPLRSPRLGLKNAASASAARVVDERSKRCHDSSKFGVGRRRRRRVRFFGIITLHIHLGVLRALLLRDSTAAEVEGVFLTTVFMVLLSPVTLTLSLPPQIARGCNARNATGENHRRDLSTIDRRRRSSHLARSPLFGHCDKLNRI